MNNCELLGVLALPRAILFLSVDWSIQSRDSQAVVTEFLAIWQVDHPKQPLACYCVDVSSQSGDVWTTISNWLTVEGRPIRSIAWWGSGPLLWLQSGHIVFHVIAAHNLTIDSLVGFTKKALSLDQTGKKTPEC